MRRWKGTSTVAALLIVASVASACSGERPAARRPSAVSSGEERAPGTAANPEKDPTVPGTVPGARGSAGTGSPVAVAPHPGGPGAPRSRPAVKLFSPSQDRIGITDERITLCLHFPKTLGPALKVLPKDVPVYWQWLNDRGGVHGRKVDLVVTDDQYTPSGGVQAAQECASNKPAPFLITGFLGIDTAPAVRQWAEQNRQLYLSPLSTERGLADLDYTFQIQPSVEQLGLVLARYVAAHWPGGSAGIVWRNSPNWQGARDLGVNVLKATGAKVTDLPVAPFQGNYTNEVIALKRAKATSVLVALNPVEFAQLEKQAAQQDYYPRWVTASLNVTTDVIGEDIDGSKGPPAIGAIFTPEYHEGDRSSKWSAEQDVMRRAYAKYDPGHTPNDIDWINWLTFKLLARMFADCGRDCTRNRFAGMLASGYRTAGAPLCDIDFSRGGGKIGSFGFNIMKVVDRGTQVGWQQLETCKERF